MTREEAHFRERGTPYTGFSYPGDTSEPIADRSRDIASVEFAMRLLLSARGTNRVQRMRATVCLAILRSELDVGEVARRFKVGREQVRRCVKQIQTLERWRGPL